MSIYQSIDQINMNCAYIVGEVLFGKLVGKYYYSYEYT